jgi:hypothetical protein
MIKEVLPHIEKCKEEIEEIEAWINKIPTDPKVRYLTNYALIKSYGTIESIYKAIMSARFDKYETQIKNYMTSTMEKSASPNYQKLCKTLKSFDEDWETDFKARIDKSNDGLKLITSINSLIQNRHSFAHGAETSISLKDIKSYYEDSIIVLDIFGDVLFQQ